MRRVSEERKRKEQRGQGVMGDYKPWIRVGEFGSIGTASVAIDWISGRRVHLLSYIERSVWLQLRFDEDNIDVREQFPLDLDVTIEIAKSLGLNHPREGKTGKCVTMTTDFLVTRKDGKQIAIAVKRNKKALVNSVAQMSHLLIEKTYWEERMLTDFRIITGDDINSVYSDNIRFVCQFYDKRNVTDNDITILKHLIATKKVIVDMNEELDLKALKDIYKEEIEEWRQSNFLQATPYALTGKHTGS